jgi:hypothetical protein
MSGPEKLKHELEAGAPITGAIPHSRADITPLGAVLAYYMGSSEDALLSAKMLLSLSSDPVALIKDIPDLPGSMKNKEVDTYLKAVKNKKAEVPTPEQLGIDVTRREIALETGGYYPKDTTRAGGIALAVHRTPNIEIT